jgi:multidrug transporter EmrE-like cation transporter
MARRKKTTRSTLTWFAYVVGFVNLGAFIVCLVVSVRGGPSVPYEVYGLMGIVTGAVFGVTMLKGNDGN